MKSWASIYKQRMNNNYYSHIKNKYEPFINKILELGNNQFAEYGCGTGNITKAILEYKPNSRHLCIDNDNEMIQLAVQNLSNYKQCILSVADILNPTIRVNKGTLIHSHGVLEHFNDEDIRKIINIQRRNNCMLVHYVPTIKYNSPSRGDERLLYPCQWRKICNPNEMIEFNQGYDLILIWK